MNKMLAFVVAIIALCAIANIVDPLPSSSDGFEAAAAPSMPDTLRPVKVASTTRSVGDGYWTATGTKMTSPNYSLDCRFPRPVMSGTKLTFGMLVKFDTTSRISFAGDYWNYMGVWSDDDKSGVKNMIEVDRSSATRFEATSDMHTSFTHDWVKYISGGESLTIKVRGEEQPRWTTLGTIKAPSAQVANAFLSACGLPSVAGYAPSKVGLTRTEFVDEIHAEYVGKPIPDPSANDGAGLELGWKKFGATGISNHFGSLGTKNQYILTCEPKRNYTDLISIRKNIIKRVWLRYGDSLQMGIWNDSTSMGFPTEVMYGPASPNQRDDTIEVRAKDGIGGLRDWMRLLSTGTSITVKFKHKNRWYVAHKMAAVPVELANDLLRKCGVKPL